MENNYISVDPGKGGSYTVCFWPPQSLPPILTNPYIEREKPMSMLYEYAVVARKSRVAEWDIVVPSVNQPFPRVLAESPRDAEVAACRAIPGDYSTENARVLVRPFCG